MSKSSDSTTKQSRRRFAKTIATALVAAPALSALSACNSTPTTNGSNENASPTPRSSPPIPTHITSGNEPPIIIDGGSLEIQTLAKLDHSGISDPDRPHSHRPHQRRYGTAKSVRITTDDGDDLFPAYTLPDNAQLEVRIWFQKAIVGGGDDDPVTYDPNPVPPNSNPQAVFRAAQNTEGFELQCANEIRDKNEHFRSGRRHWKYLLKEWDVDPQHRLPFRIGKAVVAVTVNGTTTTPSGGLIEGDNRVADGVRVIVKFNLPTGP